MAGSPVWRRTERIPPARTCGRTGRDWEICLVLRAGFVEVETSIEAAPTILDSAGQYNEFVRNIIMRRHLENIPSEQLRTEFMAKLTDRASADNPPFSLDYRRLNLRGRAG